MISCILCACVYFVRRGVWDDIIHSGLMRSFFSEFDQEEIGRKLEIDMMNQYGGGYRDSVFDTTADLDDTVNTDILSDDEDEDEEAVN